MALLIVTPAAGEEPAVISDLKVTTLSTMLTEFRGVGEWGYVALVEADGHRVLFDTVILSHNHFDHTGGLVTLRRAFKAENASAMQTAHVGDGIFLRRKVDEAAVGRLQLPEGVVLDVRQVRESFEAEGGHIVVHDEPYELHPGIWITGPIPRIHPERNWSPISQIERDGSLEEDTIPEDQALIINTPKGLVVLAGCGHAGIVNTMEYARSIAGGKQVHAVLGGFHLMGLTDEKVDWTGAKMHEFGIEHLLGAHCTGINAVNLLRDSAQLGRRTSVVGAVGSIFTLADGIRLGALNR